MTKPAQARAISLASGPKIVIVGSKAWLSQDGTTFTSVPQGVATGMLAAFDPNLMLGAFGGDALTRTATDMGTEQKNGVDAHHFRVDANTPGANLASFPPDAAVDIWMANDGYLVALETKGFAGDKDVQIEVTNVNDPANKVEEPS